jgi:DNA-binding transcriptional LysR family regulator
MSAAGGEQTMSSSFVHVHLVALRYFGETVRTGSMRQAAEQLNVAASAVNRQILKLEDQLQCKLFDRRAEGVRLTSAGEVLYNYILRLERDLDRAVSQIDDLRGLRRGHIRLACEDGIGRDFLPWILADFHTEYPGISYTVEIASALDILAQVAEGDVDIGIAMAPPARPDVAIHARAVMPVGVIVAPGHPFAGFTSIRLRDLMTERLIEAKDGTGGGTNFYAQLGNGLPRSRFIETNAPDFITNLVQAGLGVGVRTPVGIMNDIETGRIVFLPIADRVAAPTLTVFGKPHRTPSISGAVLMEMLKDRLPAFQQRVQAIGTPAGQATEPALP